MLKVIFGQGFRCPPLFERYYTDTSSQAANPGVPLEQYQNAPMTWMPASGRALRLVLGVKL